MLVHLSIHNYAIVDHLDLELDGGMSAISGETGAGKSIMLDALGLCLGDRADSGVVRPGADKADILASFDLTDIPEARAWLAERDLDSDGPCILRRVITAEGRSRGYINGSPCPQGDLKALGELLIEKLAPINARFVALKDDAAALDAILDKGAEKARALAKPTLDAAYAALGLCR